MVAQRRSLVWPVTASARGGSFLARPGTRRASPAAPLGVPATARRLLPLPLKRQPQPQTLPLRSRAGSSARLRWGGAGLECGFAEIKGAPSSPRSSSGRGLASRWFNVLRDSDAPRTTLSLHRGGSSSSQAPAGDPPPCRVPPICAAPRATGIRRVRSFLPPAPMSASHRAGVIG